MLFCALGLGLAQGFLCAPWGPSLSYLNRGNLLGSWRNRKICRKCLLQDLINKSKPKVGGGVGFMFRYIIYLSGQSHYVVNYYRPQEVVLLFKK